MSHTSCANTGRNRVIVAALDTTFVIPTTTNVMHRTVMAVGKFSKPSSFPPIQQDSPDTCRQWVHLMIQSPKEVLQCNALEQHLLKQILIPGGELRSTAACAALSPSQEEQGFSLLDNMRVKMKIKKWGNETRDFSTIDIHCDHRGCFYMVGL